MKVNKETAYKPQGIRKEFLMRDALRDEMIKKICVRDTDNILDVGCGDGTFLHELTRWKDVEGYVTISTPLKIHRSLLMKHFVS